VNDARPEGPKRKNRDERPSLERALRRMKGLIIEAGSTNCIRLALHHFDKRFQVIVRRVDVFLFRSMLILHALNAV